MAYRKLENFRITQKVEKKFCYTAYEAIDKNTEEPIYLKLLDPELNDDKDTVFNFINGARVARKLDNPNICKILSYGTDENFHFIASEPIPYRRLTDLILDTFSLSLPDLLLIFTNIAETLRYAHLNGLIHGILNPQSIYVNSDCDIKIDDFGFNWLVPEVFRKDTKASRFLAQYIAPEYYKTPELIDGQGDIYSLGILLFEILSGKAPFQGEALPEIQVQHLKGRLPRLDYASLNLPDELDTIIKHSLSRFKEQRYSNLNQFLDALTTLKEKYADVWQGWDEKTGPPAPKSTSAKIPAVDSVSKFRIFKVIAGGVILLSLLVAVIFGVNRFWSEASPPGAQNQPALSTETNGTPGSADEPHSPAADSLVTEDPEQQEPEESSDPGYRNGVAADAEQKPASRPEARAQPSAEPEPEPAPARVTMVVTSNNAPVEASIYLDDRFIGKTDRNGRFMLGELERGKTYSARVVKDGYTEETKAFTPSGATSSVNFDLKPKQNVYGTLIVDAVPHADSVFVGGKLHKGELPLQLRLHWGEHQVRLVNTRLNKEWQQTVELRVGQVMRLKHDFTQVEYGKVAVALNNAHEFGFGYVYVNGELWQEKHNTTPIELRLPVGVHTIAVKRDGFTASPPEVKVEVEENTTKRVAFTFSKAGGAN